MGRGQLYYIKTKRRRFKTGRLVFLLVLCGFLATVLLSIRFIGVLNSMQDSSPWTTGLPQPADGQKEHILIFTVADKASSGHATEVVLTAYQPAKKDFRAIHLPADTLVEMADSKKALGQVYEDGGREQLVATVSELINIPIHYFLEIDEDAIPRTIDRVGGVKEQAIGNGTDVLNYIYANNLSPSQRLERRRTVLAALAGRAVSGNWWQRLKTLYNSSPLLATNLSWRKLLLTFESLKDAEYKQSVNFMTLPGDELIEPEGSYWQADTARLPYLAAWLAGDVSQIPRSYITVEVLNGSGVSGVASQAASRLEAEGFTVVRVGNADHYDYVISQVISRVANVDGARDVASLIPAADMRKEEIPDFDVMVTVIIGKNYPEQ